VRASACRTLPSFGAARICSAQFLLRLGHPCRRSTRKRTETPMAWWFAKCVGGRRSRRLQAAEGRDAVRCSDRCRNNNSQARVKAGFPGGHRGCTNLPHTSAPSPSPFYRSSRLKSKLSTTLTSRYRIGFMLQQKVWK
jgi:hypothetical protein